MSPTVFREGQYRFFFFSREETRMHVHVICSGGEAKFWIQPHVELSVSKGLTEQAVREAEEIVGRRRQEIVDAWNRHFQS